MKDRHTLRVSCKCALYTPDGSKVLLSQYGPHGYGIPGGHIEDGEQPDDAMRRELFEEIGVRDVELEHKDFWMHHNGKIILGYTGVIDESTALKLQLEEISAAKWVPVADVANGRRPVPSYGEFISPPENPGLLSPGMNGTSIAERTLASA